MDQILEAPPPPPPPPLPLPADFSARVFFNGHRPVFTSMVVKGGLLEIVTAGFYRFWLATDIRRHLWSHVVVDGDSAEYTGRGKELLIGFLIAMAILVPIYVAYALAGLAAERVKAFASVPLFLFLYVFGQFAIYRARRYRLSRTVWRGVRFWMMGSGWYYALIASLWGILVVLTLGIAMPWRDAALERYKMKNSYYGDLQGSFEGQGWEFFKEAWWLWLLSPTAILLVPAPFLYGAFRAIQWRWWLNGVRFGDARLTSNLQTDALWGLYWKVIGWSFLLSLGVGIAAGLLAAIVAGISAGLGGSTVGTASGPFTATAISIYAVTALSYLGYLVGMNAVARIVLTHDMWERVSSSVRVHGLNVLEQVAAKGDLVNAIGEGFADGLDIGGF